MVQFINSFEVPVGQEEAFVALWAEVNAYMVGKPGYVSHQLHRSVDPQARYRFVNLAVWQSAEHWRAAHDAGFREMVSRPEWAGFTSTPALYDVVHAGAAPA